MKYRYVLAMASAILSADFSVVHAADLGLYQPRTTFSRAACSTRQASHLAGLPFETVRGEIHSRYRGAVAQSEDDRTMFNRSPRILWAFASRYSCGIALGYLATGELNFERLADCECHYARMVSFLSRR
jgi:hypothetical protein